MGQATGAGKRANDQGARPAWDGMGRGFFGLTDNLRAAAAASSSSAQCFLLINFFFQAAHIRKRVPWLAWTKTEPNRAEPNLPRGRQPLPERANPITNWPRVLCFPNAFEQHFVTYTPAPSCVCEDALPRRRCLGWCRCWWWRRRRRRPGQASVAAARQLSFGCYLRWDFSTFPLLCAAACLRSFSFASPCFFFFCSNSSSICGMRRCCVFFFYFVFVSSLQLPLSTSSSLSLPPPHCYASGFCSISVKCANYANYYR